MPDNHYEHPILASFYDICCGWSEDYDFYLSLAAPHTHPLHILDVGCGTGMLADAYANRKHHVTGVDPAASMLDIARTTPHSPSISWIHADAASFQLDHHVDLAVMTGHAFQVFLTPEDLLAALHNIRKHLKPNATFAFETRNPTIDWASRWYGERSFDTPHGPLRTVNTVTSQTPTHIHFTTTFDFPQHHLTSHSTLRFWTLDQLRTLLHTAGLTITHTYGDWDRSPFHPEHSLELILCTQPTPTPPRP